MSHCETTGRNRFIAKLVGVAVVVATGSALLSMPTATRVRAAADENVKVVNTTASPVPVVVQGTPTFTLASGPATPLLVRDVDSPPRHGYQASQNILTDVVSGTGLFTVPSGYLAVIEHVSLSGGFEGNGITQAFVRCTNFTQVNVFDPSADFQEVNHSLVLVPQGTNPTNGVTFYSASQPIHCIASGSAVNLPTLSIHVQTGVINTAQHTWVMAVSGYLVSTQ